MQINYQWKFSLRDKIKISSGAEFFHGNFRFFPGVRKKLPTLESYDNNNGNIKVVFITGFHSMRYDVYINMDPIIKKMHVLP